MLLRRIGLTLVLIYLAVGAVCAAGTEEMRGTIRSAESAKIGDMIEILLTLEGRPETFVVHLRDAQKFGLTKTSTDLVTMLQEIVSTKGWQVTLACEKTNNPQGPEYLVKALTRLPGK